MILLFYRDDADRSTVSRSMPVVKFPRNMQRSRNQMSLLAGLFRSNSPVTESIMSCFSMGNSAMCI